MLNSQKNYLPIFKNQQKTLNCNQAATLIRNFKPSENKHVEKIHKPLGGQVFIFSSNDIEEANDYKCDGYNWR